MSQLDLFYADQEPVEFKNLQIYRSSAGSGKTFTIVKEYLKLILMDPENYKKILAITFTNKASQEMKERILHDLASIALDQSSDMRTGIEEDFRDQGVKDMPIAKRASTAFKKILHNYGRFGVSTLDHFFAKVVRGFAKELNLPLKFDIDVDEDRAIDYAVARLYEKMEAGGALQKWLEEFSYSMMESDRGWDIDRNLKDLGKQLFNENFRKGIGQNKINFQDVEELVKSLAETKRNYESYFREQGKEALTLIDVHGLQTTDFLSGNRGFANTFKKIVNNNEFSLNKTFKDTATGDKQMASKTSPNSRKIEYIQENGLQNIVERLYTYHEKHSRKYTSSIVLLKHIHSYGILDVLNEQLVAYRTENNLVLLSDHAFLLHEIIEDNDPPIIYEKLGARYNHIQVDEFQDTSIYQWQNLLPLVKNGLQNMGHTLIVGDIKQSIYRWRGGEMKLLVSGVEKDLELFSDQTEVQNLEFNWRSASNVVKFNNEFFRVASKDLSENPNIPSDEILIPEAYKNVQQKPRIEDEGYIEVQFFSDTYEDSWKAGAKRRTLEVIKESIGKGYNYGDIMILVDKWDLGHEIAAWLIKNEIKVITDNSLQVQNNTVVRVLINAIKWLHDSDDRLAKTNLLYLYTSMKRVGEFHYNEIFTDIHNEGVLFNRVMPEFFLKNLGVFLKLPLYELVETLLQTFDLGGLVNNFVLRFQEICLEQSAKGKSDLLSFLSWWEESKDKLVVITPETNEAVWIMTVHKAKGLEKPIVIVPFADYPVKTKSPSIFWTDRLEGEYKRFSLLPLDFERRLEESEFIDAYQQEYMEGMLERLNVTYVAFTRAKQCLYIFSRDVKDIRDGTALNKLLLRVFSNESFKYSQFWDPITKIFRWGKEVEIEVLKDKQVDNIEVLQENLIKDSLNVTVKPESSRFFLLFDNEKSEKIKKGIILHRVFEELGSRDGLGKVIKKMVNEGLISNSQVELVTRETEEMFQMKQLQDWFDGSWTTIVERSIVSEKGIFRPDRVMIKDGEVIVIDYKTGANDPKHEKQLHTYASLLGDLGYKNISKYLVYLGTKEIVDVK